MISATTATIVKILDTLPEGLQDRVLEHLCEYVEDIREEKQWHESFSRLQDKLAAAARRVRKEIAEGKSDPFDPEML